MLYKRKIISKYVIRERTRCIRDCSHCFYTEDDCHNILVMIYNKTGWYLVYLPTLCKCRIENYFYLET